MRFYEIRESAYQGTNDLSVLDQYIDTIFGTWDYFSVYRGLSSKYENGENSNPAIFIVDANSMNRKAANTSNICNIMTTILPSWKNWPKRPQSVVGSTSFHHANAYGGYNNDNIYQMYPLENQPIGVCISSLDFWFCFPLSIATINSQLLKCAEYVNIKNFVSDNPNEIIEKTDFILKELKKKEINIELSNKFLNFFLSADNALQFFNTILDPTYGNTLVKNYSSFPTNAEGEVWLSGKILLVKKSVLEKSDFRQKLRKKIKDEN